MRVLLCDDDRAILHTVGDYLALQALTVDFAGSGREALNRVRSDDYDVIVLDVRMPGMSGLDCCRTMRAEGVLTPILFLTARDSLDDTLLGFEAGADDYLVKPFAFQELHARLSALGKRYSRQGAAKLEVGELSIDLATGEVRRRDDLLKLNRIQFLLLRHLAMKSPALASRKELEELVWGDDPPDSDVLRVHMSALRRIVDKPFGSNMLKTVHGLGFRLTDA